MKSSVKAAGTYLTDANSFIKSVPAYSRVNAGINLGSIVAATARVINAINIITMIIPDLYALVTVSR